MLQNIFLLYNNILGKNEFSSTYNIINIIVIHIIFLIYTFIIRISIENILN